MVLDVPVEGYLVADEDVDGVALDAVLFLFLVIGAEGEVRRPTPLPWCVAVGRRLDVEGPSQLSVRRRLLRGQASRGELLGLLLVLLRGIGRERGTF